MADTFDPFELPSSFDPLGSGCLEPNGQSAYLRQDSPPRRTQAATAAQPPLVGAGGRLAHLLAPAAAPAVGRQRGVGSVAPTEPAQRLAEVEDEVTILQARLDALEATLTARLDAQGARILQAVATLIDARIGSRG